MKDWKKKIPEEFWHGDNKPSADTVGELIKILKQLPKKLPLMEPQQVTVYNISNDDRGCLVEDLW